MLCLAGCVFGSGPHSVLRVEKYVWASDYRIVDTALHTINAATANNNCDIIVLTDSLYFSDNHSALIDTLSYLTEPPLKSSIPSTIDHNTGASASSSKPSSSTIPLQTSSPIILMVAK